MSPGIPLSSPAVVLSKDCRLRKSNSSQSRERKHELDCARGNASQITMEWLVVSHGARCCKVPFLHLVRATSTEMKKSCSEKARSPVVIGSRLA